MALNYLLSPEFQVVNTAGKPATGGYLEVYISGSRERYYCASDFNGTLYPFQVPLDSLGSNVVLADDSHAYDVYIYNRYGSLLMSRYNVHPGAGGGSIGTGDITSSDGSIIVTQTANGVDLRTNSTPPSILRATAETLYMDGQFTFAEAQRDGQNAIVDAQGNVIVNEGWWHYDGTVKLRWTGPAQNETQAVSLYTQNSSDSLTFDMSFPHNETVQVSGEYKALNDSTQFVLGVTGVPSGMSVELVDFGVHSIIGEGAGGSYDAGTGIVINEADRIISIDPDVVQEKLTAGNNITIEDNVISATAEPQVQADWAQTDSEAVDYIKNKPSIPTVDQTYDASSANAQSGTAVAEAIAGADNLFIAVYGVTTISEVDTAYAQGKDLICRYNDGRGHVYSSQLSSFVSGAYTFTTNDGYTDYEFKLSPDGGTGAWTIGSRAIPSGTQLVPAATQSDVGEVLTVDSNGDPTWAPAQAPISAGNGIDITNNVVSVDTSVVATQTDLAGKQDVISDLSSIRAGAAAGATAVQDPDYVHTDNNYTDADKAKLAGIEAGAEVNVQSDWAESDSSSDSFILNKPTLATVATSGSYTDLSNTPSIPTATSDLTNDSGYITLSDVPAQVQADWTETDTNAASYIQHKPTIPPTLSAGDGIDITNNVVSAKVDGSTVTINASGELQAAPAITVDQTYNASSTHPQSGTAVADALSDYTPTSSLATVATSGSYADLSNTPTIPTATSDLQNDSGFITASDVPSNQVQSDWNESDTSEPAYIQNKPTMKELVAGTNISIAEGQNTVTISATAAPQVQADWSESDTSDVSYIQNKPDLSVYALSANLATVATSGDYADLTNKPTIPTVPTTDQQYNPNSTNPQSGTAVAEAIAGTGQVPTVTSSDNDKVLTATYSGGIGSFAWQTPSTTQVQADWTEADSTDPSYIQNKPNLATVATSGDYNDLSNKPTIPAAQVNSDWSANSGVAQILNKPTVKPVLAGSNITITETANDFTIAASVPVIGTITV